MFSDLFSQICLFFPGHLKFAMILCCPTQDMLLHLTSSQEGAPDLPYPVVEVSCKCLKIGGTSKKGQKERNGVITMKLDCEK